MALTLSVGGDPDGGWLVDIHDGDRHEVYRPNGGKPIEAAIAALFEHDPEQTPKMAVDTEAEAEGAANKDAVARLTKQLSEAAGQLDQANAEIKRRDDEKTATVKIQMEQVEAQEKVAMAQAQAEHQQGAQAAMQTALAEQQTQLAQPANDAAPEDHPAA